MPLPHASVVLDIGSLNVRAGFSGEEAPRASFQSCVGLPRHDGLPASLLGFEADIVAGDAAAVAGGMLRLRWPVHKGHVQDAEALEQLLWHTLYTQLEVVPERTPLQLVVPHDQTRAAREQLAELLFEQFSTPMFGLLNSAAATAYAAGVVSGLILDSGASRTTVAAVSEGYVAQHSARASDVAGEVLTEELLRALRGRGYPLTTPADRRLVERAKEEGCAVSLDLAADLAALDALGGADPSVSFALPDDETLHLFDHRFRVPELLFDPAPWPGAAAARPSTPTGYSATNAPCQAPLRGWGQTVLDVAAACPPYLQPSLTERVVLGGGTTLLAGAGARLQRELVTAGAPTKVIALADRAHAAWTGASIWASSADPATSQLSKADWHEHGESIIHRYAL